MPKKKTNEVVEVTIVITNEKAARALAVAVELADELAEDLPWNDEIRRLRSAVRYAFKRLDVRQT